MKFTPLSVALSLSLSASALAASLPPIEIVGNKFFFSNNGSQFYIRGIAYQSNSLVNQTKEMTFNDPLANAEACKRDIPYLQRLSTNVIRVYAINTSLDHSECMSALNDAGIYVISDLSEPGLSIDRSDPRWNLELYKRYTDVIDALANYTNVLGFFAGNEVTNANNNTDASAFVKAAIRDMKSYIKEKHYRDIPVGYSASDDAGPRVPEAAYFACGDASEHADFYGMNMYEWCGDSDFETSGYADRTAEFRNMSIPLFFSEYGCNAVQPRKFSEIGTIYGDKMTDVWSGGIVYMYFQEENDYGLVQVDESSNKIETLVDFGYLSSALKAISPTSAHASDITTSKSVIACPASTMTNWKAATVLPPTPNEDVCNCLSPASGCRIKDSADDEDYSEIFGYICGVISCSGIIGNATTGHYGSFVGCNPKDQLNYVLNEYYNAQSHNAKACDFNGRATVVKNPRTNDYCSSVFKAAGPSATGAIGAISASTTEGSSSSSSSISSSSASRSTSRAASSSFSARASSTRQVSTSNRRDSDSTASASKGSSSNAAPVVSGNMKYVTGALAAAFVAFAGFV